jgi:hypothetical protein
LESQAKREVIALDEAERTRVEDYLTRFGDKALLKYVDLTPMWTADGVESFPKCFPYLVNRKLHLSSYHGFNFYLSSRRDYMTRMPVQGNNVLAPDWDWAIRSGADFAVINRHDLERSELDAVAQPFDPSSFLSVPDNVLIVPLRRSGSLLPIGTMFDNGYFRVTEQRADLGRADGENIALGKPARQSSTTLGAAGLAVDGNTDGRFAADSVTHTDADPNAWLEVDLGKPEWIDYVRIWNRTDCCAERLSHYWVFISEKPFDPHDTALQLAARPGVWGRRALPANPDRILLTSRARGRYVRVQLGGEQALAQSFLSLAELQVFRGSPPAASEATPRSSTHFRLLGFESNDANLMRLDFDTDQSTLVQYLLWPNPGLRYFVDGEMVKPERRLNEPVEWKIPKGRHIFEVRYRNKTLLAFWLTYGLFAVACMWAMFAKAWPGAARLKAVRSGMVAH